MDNYFTIHPSLDIAGLRSAYLENGRVEILDFLGESQADALRLHLEKRSDWTLVLNAGERVYEIPREGAGQLTTEQRDELDKRIIDAGRHGFQYRYEAIRVPDDPERRRKSNSLLDRFVDFMSSRAVLDVLREITNANDVDFADGQATAYSTGHFLTAHDDNVAGKHRRAAYVIGLSPMWRSEWGGLLMFHRDDGNIAEAFVPAIGALRLFAVPSLHSVSYVTPFAPEARLAVTGWLRVRAPRI